MEDSDDEFFGSTGVMLGFKGKSLRPEDHTALDNHIGGVPSWFADQGPDKALLECLVCQSELRLLAQIYAPLEDTDYDRALYVFACPQSGCYRKQGSIRALRAVYQSNTVTERLAKEAGKPAEPALPKLGDQLFGISSGSSSSSSTVNPFASGEDPFASLAAAKPATTKSRPKEKAVPKPANAIDANILKCFDLEVEEEEITPEKMDPNIQIDDTVMELDDGGAEPSGSAAGSAGDAVLDGEMAAVLEAITDPVFAHFVSITNNNPDQVLRYKRNLQPLVYANDGMRNILSDEKRIPQSDARKNAQDNGSRSFELQLMPRLIAELETEDQIAEGMEWGTIVVATSNTDAFPELDSQGVGYVEEWVGVQWEALNVESR